MDGLVQQNLEQNLLQAAKTIEDAVDVQLHRLENLQEDDIERIRQKRIHDMKRNQMKRQEWLNRGHGELTEVSEQEFFKVMKGEERMVCLFYRESPPCEAMEKHLRILAPKHLETKFVKLQAEKSPFLAERLKIWMLPTLAIIQNEKTTDYIVGLDDLGGTESFESVHLENRLVDLGAIFEDPQTKKPTQDVVDRTNIRKGGYAFNRTASDEDSDFE